MILLAGLGNPGAKYENNRHNVGFLAADLIAERHNFGPWRSRFQGEVAEGRLGTQKCLLLKPSTYMNESGQSVGEAARFYKIPLEDIVVIHDELDLKPGKLKVKTGGGNAGHNGLKSIDAHIGNKFRRLRVGIGHPGRPELVSNYVLHDFSKQEREWLDPLLQAIADAAPLLASGEDASFMNDVARATGGGSKTDEKKKAKTGKTAKDKNETTNPPGPQTTPHQTSQPDQSETALGAKLKKWLRPDDD